MARLEKVSIEDMLAFDANRIVPKRLRSGGNERVRTLFQSDYEEAVILVDQRNAAVLEEGQIKVEDAALPSEPGLEEGTLVGWFRR